MDEVLSSRIFVKGLPPTFTEAEFRKHFARDGEITDAKIFPNRRIGYIGYRTPEDAQKAVKYFNRTFIRMSKIGVEIARPPAQAVKQQASSTPTARRDGGALPTEAETGGVKRKRESGTKEDDDPKLKEFLESYKPKSNRKAWESEALEVSADAARPADTQEWNGIAEGQSDDEYQTVPKKAKRAVRPDEQTAEVTPAPVPVGDAEPAENMDHADGADGEGIDAGAAPAATSDADWARSRTSRLLGLLGEEEDEVSGARGLADDTDQEDAEVKTTSKLSELEHAVKVNEAAGSLPSPPSDEPVKDQADADASEPAATSRLFVRNLPYNVREEDLTAEFTPFGDLEEVGPHLFSIVFDEAAMMNPDRDNLCNSI